MNNNYIINRISIMPIYITSTIDTTNLNSLKNEIIDTINDNLQYLKNLENFSEYHYSLTYKISEIYATSNVILVKLINYNKSTQSTHSNSISIEI